MIEHSLHATGEPSTPPDYAAAEELDDSDDVDSLTVRAAADGRAKGPWTRDPTDGPVDARNLSSPLGHPDAV